MTKILIIEDEESILMPLEDNLKLEGYEVSCARDGQQGLSMAVDRSFDLIVLDIMLPKMDGFEVCKRLRQDRVMTPILMLTAKSQEVDKVLGLELGADDYVTKPFSSRGRVVHRNEVLDCVWGKDVYVDARTVDKHISLLRKKFEDDPQEPKYILGVGGLGYKFT